jgi:hypothetical protein
LSDRGLPEELGNHYRQKLASVVGVPLQAAKTPEQPKPAPTEAEILKGWLDQIVKSGELKAQLDEIEQLRKTIQNRKFLIDNGIVPKGFTSNEALAESARMLEKWKDTILTATSANEVLLDILKTMTRFNPAIREKVGSGHVKLEPETLAEAKRLLEKKINHLMK